MGEMAAELTGLSVLKVLMWSRDVESNNWKKTGETKESVICSDVLWSHIDPDIHKQSRYGSVPGPGDQTGLTFAVLSLEALMNMVRSTDVWMSLICLECSLAFFRISPDCPAATHTSPTDLIYFITAVVLLIFTKGGISCFCTFPPATPNMFAAMCPTLALIWLISPFSCPAITNSPRGPHTALVILWSLQGIDR